MDAYDGTLFYIRGGMVRRLVVYLDRDRAFADLGVAAQAHFQE
jgi:hypothetical protein